MTYSLRKHTLLFSAVLALTVPCAAFAQDDADVSSNTTAEHPNLDGSRLQERWQRVYENATPEQQQVLDQKKTEFQALSPEEQQARLKDYGEGRLDRMENKIDRAENKYDRREDVIDSRHDGGVYDKIEDRYDRREDVRDRAENRRDRAENKIDRRFVGGERRFRGNP